MTKIVTQENSLKQKYPKPKILLVDIDDDTYTTLQSKGYNVCKGSIFVSDAESPLKVNLPNLTEQEIVFINIMPLEPLVTANLMVSPIVSNICSIRNYCDRITRNGGIFVIFASKRESDLPGNLEMLDRTKISNRDNWGYLSDLCYNNIEIKVDPGNEIKYISNKKELCKVLESCYNGIEITYTLFPHQNIQRRWTTIATNKYDIPIAGVIWVPNEKEDGPLGAIMILPKTNIYSSIIFKLLKNILPTINPQLFPQVNLSHWIDNQEYELSEVSDCIREIRKIKIRADIEINNLSEKITDIKKKYDYLYKILTDTGDSLVEAVKNTLKYLGFKDVRISDNIQKDGMIDKRKREDIQIYDKSPILLIEVKGIASIPSDEDALQAIKYTSPRMREWNRTDVKSLTILNHQRNLPPYDRDCSPFREDILENADAHELGLLTTWGLFKLVMRSIKHKWSHEIISEIFYRNGKIEPIPINYEYIGRIDNYYNNKNVVAIKLELSYLTKGDNIAYEYPFEFIEQTVDSLQVDKKPVDRAEVGAIIGIKSDLPKDKAKKGTRVFRIKQS